MNQNRKVLNHLIDHGYITDLIARNYGIRRLASRMHDLKNQGVKFEVESRRDDNGTRYAHYSMSENTRFFERGLRDRDALIAA